ncbi:MAG: hypothetical protein MI723_14985 [Caulobacterales bacterium]|nr:hypothetical protein [Caulobacterales bacterium]
MKNQAFAMVLAGVAACLAEAAQPRAAAAQGGVESMAVDVIGQVTRVKRIRVNMYDRSGARTGSLRRSELSLPASIVAAERAQKLVLVVLPTQETAWLSADDVEFDGFAFDEGPCTGASRLATTGARMGAGSAHGC